MPTEWTNVRVRKDIYTRVAELAAAEDRSARWWVERALETALATGLRQAVTPAQSEDPHARLSPSGSSAPPVAHAPTTPHAKREAPVKTSRAAEVESEKGSGGTGRRASKGGTSDAAPATLPSYAKKHWAS